MNFNNMADTNPHGANGTTSDPREQICWDLYIQSILDQRENAYKSAIEAGYSEDSARNVTMRDWFKERLGKLRRKDMFSKAEKVLDKTLTYEPVNDEGKIDTALLRVQTDVAKHITSTLGKDEGYSTKSDDMMKKLGDSNIVLVKFIDAKDNRDTEGV